MQKLIVPDPGTKRPFSALGAGSAPTLPRSMIEKSVIGRDLTIMGEKLVIISKGFLQVDGALHGELRCAEVVIGENGSVTGGVMANQVEIHGSVNGVVAGMSVVLRSTARVEGEIHSQSLTIAAGAHFEGRARRPSDVAELMPHLDAAPVASLGR